MFAIVVVVVVVAFTRNFIYDSIQFIVCYVLCKLFNSINRLHFLCLLIVALTSFRARNTHSIQMNSDDLQWNAAGVCVCARVQSASQNVERKERGRERDKERERKRKNKMPKQFVVCLLQTFSLWQLVIGPK